ncbi:hypothetical protein McpSp1_10140 [Methanocorpusculaceae archaeon Sp1]|nr:hypothetical protein [Methanocorpusculaceae archaeon Sp1]
MKPVVKTITCPKCGSKQDFTMYPSINASSDPGLAEKYTEGSLTMLSCNECGFSGKVEYPMLYHDLDRKYSVFFAPDTEDREVKLPNVLPAHLLPEMQLRLTHSSDDLREKTFIFRDHLDDRIVETMKDSILREMDARHEEMLPDKLYYAEDLFECAGRSLIFVPQKGEEFLEPIKVPFDTYEKIKMLMHGIWDRPVLGYSVVDSIWVQSAAPKERS